MQFELTKEFLDEISVAIKQQNNLFIEKNVSSLHPADIAEIMDYVSLEEAQFIYTLLQEEKAADVLVEIDEDVRDKFLESLSPKEIAESIENMDSDDATDLIQDLPEKKTLWTSSLHSTAPHPSATTPHRHIAATPHFTMHYIRSTHVAQYNRFTIHVSIEY